MAKPPNYTIVARLSSRMSYVCYKKNITKDEGTHSESDESNVEGPSKRENQNFGIVKRISVCYIFAFGSLYLKEGSEKNLSISSKFSHVIHLTTQNVEADGYHPTCPSELPFLTSF